MSQVPGAPPSVAGTQSAVSNLTKTEELILKPPMLGVRCCNFGLTFKSDPQTDSWLLYQEYSRDQMTHTHCLEVETFSSIKEYVQFYASKVKSLSELKELIYEKFGLEYTIN